MIPKLVAASRLAAIADELVRVKPGTKRWKQLQDELDRLCGTQEVPRDRAAEAAWEKGKKD